MDLSFQLYSAREFTPWADVFAMLSGFGVKNVEGFGPLYGDAAETKALMEANGLSMPSGHFALTDLEGDLDGVVATCKTLGIQRVFAPFLMPEDRPTDADGWRDVGERLASIGVKLVDHGLRFGWHNHDFELRPLPDGAVPMDILLTAAPDIEWECDVAWIVRGDADPKDWIDRYGDRISTAHVKDIARDGQNADEDGWADVGAGTMDWKSLTAALRSAGCDLFILEHDKPSDATRFTQTSVENFNGF